MSIMHISAMQKLAQEIKEHITSYIYTKPDLSILSMVDHSFADACWYVCYATVHLSAGSSFTLLFSAVLCGWHPRIWPPVLRYSGGHQPCNMLWIPTSRQIHSKDCLLRQVSEEGRRTCLCPANGRGTVCDRVGVGRYRPWLFQKLPPVALILYEDTVNFDIQRLLHFHSDAKCDSRRCEDNSQCTGYSVQLLSMEYRTGTLRLW